MNTYPATDIVLILGAIGVLITSIITAVRGNTAAKNSVKSLQVGKDTLQVGVENAERLDEVHKQTNSTLDGMKNEIKNLRDTIGEQERAMESYRTIIQELRNYIKVDGHRDGIRKSDEKILEDTKNSTQEAGDKGGQRKA